METGTEIPGGGEGDITVMVDRALKINYLLSLPVTRGASGDGLILRVSPHGFACWYTDRKKGSIGEAVSAYENLFERESHTKH